MEWTHLPPSARTLFYLQALLNLLVFWVPVSAAAGAFLAYEWSLAGGIAIAATWLALRLVYALWMPSLAYDRWAYAVRDGDLLVSRGVIFRTITAVPAHRIQHVDTRQGPIEQVMGLSSVQIFTASGMGADAHIPGLPLDVAEALRDRLLRERGDDGV